MALHKVVVRSSTIVLNNTQNSFAFAAPIPPLGAFTMPEMLVSVDDAYLFVQALGGAAFGGPFALNVRVNGTC